MDSELFPSAVAVASAEGGGWWMEIPHEAGTGWAVTARIVEQGGFYAIAEIRVHPNRRLLQRDGASTAGQWDPRDRVPRGGITARQLHGVRVGRVLAIWRRYLELFGPGQPHGSIGLTRKPLDVSADLGGQLHAAPLLDIPARKRTTGPGRPRRPDATFLPIAEDYSLLVASGDRHITRTLADHYGIPPVRVTALVQEARRRGLLSRPSRRGTAVGDLTAKARELRKRFDIASGSQGAQP